MHQQETQWIYRIGERLKGLGAIALFVLVSVPAQGQIRSDRTLRRESSTQRTIDLNGETVDLIDGGARRADNLFHSFSTFNINEGQRVYFEARPRIDRIFARVTGDRPSDIQGTLGVLGNADLFLINPNGILFGLNASLDIQGSFVATTASAVEFGDRGTFSALNPQVPAPLTVHPSALSFAQQQSTAPIRNVSRAFTGLSSTDEPISGLRVADGEGLFLVGGDILFDGGQVAALGGRVELAGLAEPGQIGLQNSAGAIALTIPETAERSNITLRQGALVEVTDNRGGDVVLTGRNIRISDSAVFSGIDGDRGSPTRKAGDIVFDASDRLRLESVTSIDNAVLAEGVGRSGDIYIQAGRLWILDEAQVGAGVRGTGTGGDIVIRVEGDAVLDASRGEESASGVFSTIGFDAIGEGGNIFLQADSIFLLNDAQLNTRTFGEGNAGSIRVIARGDLVLDNAEGIRDTTGLASRAEVTGDGNGGDITIEARSLSVLSGAQIVASTRATGDGGDISISVDDSIQVSGQSPTQIFSGIFSRVNPEAVGNAGQITITTDTLRITDGAIITASTRGEGNAGKIDIQAGEQVVVAGASPDGFPSEILSSVDETGVGNSSQIAIETPVLIVRDRGVISAETSGQGFPGNLRIQAERVEIRNQGQLQVTSASLFTSPGNVVLSGAEDIVIQGQNSGIFANATSEADAIGGSIRIRGTNLTVEDGGAIAVSSESAQGGSLFISVDQIRLDQGTLTAETRSGSPGPSISNEDGEFFLAVYSANIELQGLDVLTMQDNSLISARSSRDFDGGNVTISAPEGFIVATPTENNDIIANAQLGNGGRISILAQGVFGIELRDRLTPNSDINASSAFGLDGVVAIDSPEVDPSDSSIDLPTTFSPPPFAQGCDVPGQNSGRLVNTGRGGTPASPGDALDPELVWQDRELYVAESSPSGELESYRVQPPQEQSTASMVEAEGWSLDEQGNPVLVAGPSAHVLNWEEWRDRCLSDS